MFCHSQGWHSCNGAAAESNMPPGPEEAPTTQEETSNTDDMERRWGLNVWFGGRQRARERNQRQRQGQSGQDGRAELERWLGFKVDFASRSLGTRQNRGLLNLFASFDTMKWIRETGHQKFLTIALLARIHISKSTSCFSVACGVDHFFFVSLHILLDKSLFREHQISPMRVLESCAEGPSKMRKQFI